MSTIMAPVDQLAGLFASEGAGEYLGEPVTVAQHLPLDHRLPGSVDPVEREPARGRPAHQAPASPASSPSTTGTPTSEPYSVHEPS